MTLTVLKEKSVSHFFATLQFGLKLIKHTKEEVCKDLHLLIKFTILRNEIY